MNRLLLLPILFLTAIAYAQPEGKLLEEAYKRKSKESLKGFFQKWNQEIVPVSNDELLKMGDTIKETYKVFKGFYKPQAIDSLGGSEWGNDIYKDVSYLLVQNSIKIYFCDKVFFSQHDSDEVITDYINKHVKDTSEKRKLLTCNNGRRSQIAFEYFFHPQYDDTLVDSIMNFRPQINCNNKTPVYLTPKFDSILNAFLGNENLPLGTGGIMNPARSTGESAKRKKFLENYIKIWYGHWGGYWQLNSYPKAFSVIFDRKMEYARVDFRMVYEGGEAILKNKNGYWTLISAKRTWIE